jgi:hypothetical protein
VATWAAITPDGGPRDVEQARARVDQLRARIKDERDRVEQAERDLATAEASDRDQMAKAFREGREPTSSTKQVEQLRAAVAEAQRRQQALDAAVDQADAELGQTIERNRDKWARDCDTRIAKAQTQAARLLAELETQLAEATRQRAIAYWLMPSGGADTGRPVKPAHDSIPGTEQMTANGARLAVGDALAWIRSVVEPAEPATSAPAPDVELAASDAA